MPPTDLPPGYTRPGAPRAGSGPEAKPEGCAIREEEGGAREFFIIPPSAEAVSLSQLAFALLWAVVWTAAIAVFVAVPGDHGAVFNFFALLAGLAGEYLALSVFFSALVARFAVERISLGPDGIEQETRVGPLRRTRRVALPLARQFRVDAYPSPRRGSRAFGARLYLIRGKAPSASAPRGRAVLRPVPMAEGARDEDKFWLASRLNERLRARRAGIGSES